jgi:hypothetical protein
MPKCKSQGCTKRASHGDKGKSPEYCGTHKQPTNTNLVTKRCIVDNCDKIPSFGIEGKPPSFCKKHKSDESVCLKKKKCTFENCNTCPTFAFKGSKPSRCSLHKQDGQTVVYRKTCEFQGCKISATFGTSDEKCKYCKTHRPSAEYKDLVSKKCEHVDCNTRPVFGVVFRKPLRCLRHMLPNDIDVKSKRCKEVECEKYPRYSSGNNSAEYCHIHKPQGFVLTKAYRCKQDGCFKSANFALPGKSRMFCFEHKLDGYEDYTHSKCKADGCKVRANFGIPGQPAEYCVKHKPFLSLDLNNKTLCASEYCLTRVEPPYKYCASCDPTQKRRTRVKQTRIYNFLNESFGNSENPITMISYDNQIRSIEPESSGCDGALRRPDFILTCNGRICLIECDENQHKEYTKKCEDKRIVDIINAMGLDRCHLIRINPDSFKCHKKETWKTQFTNRMSVLLQTIRKRYSSELELGDFTIDKICFDCPDDCIGGCGRVHSGTFTWQSGDMQVNMN